MLGELVVLIPPVDEIEEPEDAFTLEVTADTAEFLFASPELRMELETLFLAVCIVLATTSNADILTELFSSVFSSLISSVVLSLLARQVVKLLAQ